MPLSNKTNKQQKITHFNPNGVGMSNANIFGLPFNYDEANIIIIPVPWDTTVSYLSGTAYAPQAIFEYSSQIDLFDFDYKNAWHAGYFMQEIPQDIVEKNSLLRSKAEQYISFLEEGKNINDSVTMTLFQSEINRACTELQKWVQQESDKVLNNNKIPIILGGEHAVPLGLMQSLNDRYNNWGILQIDAHADLRIAYEGFTFSHASIMYNALKNCQNLSKLVSVGVRDFCDAEYNLAKTDKRIKAFYWHEIAKNRMENYDYTWQKQCEAIIQHLPQNVYISFDIDGLQANFCPNTGTPVVGGLTFDEATYLIKKIVDSGRIIIGADLCEVSLGSSYPTTDTTKELNANVGCRVLYKLCGAIAHSNKMLT